MMIGATIDLYHEEIADAVDAGDERRIANIARCFYERHKWYKRWALLQCDVFTNPRDGCMVNILIQFEGGKLADLSIAFPHGKQRVMLDGESIVRSRMDEVVEVLGVPMAFLDGIYFFAQAVYDQTYSQIGKLHIERDELAKDVFELRQEKEELQRRVKILEDDVHLLSPSKHGRPVTLVDLSSCAEKHREQFIRVIPCTGHTSVAEAREVHAGCSGLYFAWCIKSGRCVYVGKSKNIGSRVSASRPELRSCRVSVIYMPEHDMHLWELFYIWLLKPERNGQVVESALQKEATDG